MKMYYVAEQNNELLHEKKMDVARERLFKTTAKLLVEEKDCEDPIYVSVKADGHEARYRVQLRSGTQAISELSNDFPAEFLPDDITDKMLVFVGEDKNAYKFYEMSVGDKITDPWKATYGRIGERPGDQFGPKICKWSPTSFYIKLEEKLGKGYIDISELYLQDRKLCDERVEMVEAETKTMAGTTLFEELLYFSKMRVERSDVHRTFVTQKAVDYCNERLAKMRAAKTVEEFNAELKMLMAVSARRIRTGDGSGVRMSLIETRDQMEAKIQDEEDLLAAMEGVLIGQQAAGNSAFRGIDALVENVTEEEEKLVRRMLTNSLKDKKLTIYRVTPKKQREKFERYCKDNNISRTKLFWHGSRNENWLSIIKNSLVLHPDASVVRTGQMYGHGLYFAPSADKSFGYTSFKGTRWARGSQSCAYMGIYETPYGTPYELDSHSSRSDYRKLVKDHGCDCLHVHGGNVLRADEVIFYHENVCLRYIVKFE